ncbi:MAG: hypothetical protein ACK4PR_07265 [Gammaproteobacteria bacterium]
MTIKNIEELSRNFLRLLKGRTRLFMLELTLARYSFLPFLLLTIGCVILTSTSWIVFLGLISYLTYYLWQNMLICLLVILLINLVVGSIAFVFLCRYIQQLKFSRTRKHFKITQSPSKESDDGKNNAIEEKNSGM